MNPIGILILVSFVAFSVYAGVLIKKARERHNRK